MRGRGPCTSRRSRSCPLAGRMVRPFLARARAVGLLAEGEERDSHPRRGFRGTRLLLRDRGFDPEVAPDARVERRQHEVCPLSRRNDWGRGICVSRGGLPSHGKTETPDPVLVACASALVGPAVIRLGREHPIHARELGRWPAPRSGRTSTPTGPAARRWKRCSSESHERTRLREPVRRTVLHLPPPSLNETSCQNSRYLYPSPPPPSLPAAGLGDSAP